MQFIYSMNTMQFIQYNAFYLKQYVNKYLFMHIFFYLLDILINLISTLGTVALSKESKKIVEILEKDKGTIF